ncbi:MAG: carboxypeptidase regulatory-like domain-containing protein [Bacteroidia bacterium]|nr:carboxypeptidase regulatory-like domain-containing protein [Bacteroidia bacterium]
MRAALVILLIPYLYASNCPAQTLTGKVRNADGQDIELANLTLRGFNKPDAIQEFTIVKGGYYEINLEKDYPNGLLVVVNALGYQPDTLVLENPIKGKTYTLNFVLSYQNTQLKEIIIEAPKAPVEVKEDTIAYNVEAYSNGSEKKIQEIIKKLPGMEVNEQTGLIKYKGRPIETVTLDGDDLFGYNYSVGTKNINVDMVEQIEAIENYSANPLLKGIEEEGKVALNLKLKKGKFDFSGEINVGAGLDADETSVFNSNNTLLGITRAYKSFASASYSNIGANFSPFDYFGFQQNPEQINEKTIFCSTRNPGGIIF